MTQDNAIENAIPEESQFFDDLLKRRFGASVGAFSRVTQQEAEKSQITITGPETEVVVGHFGEENIHHGPKRDNPAQATKTFGLFDPEGQPNDIELTLNYPKPHKTELQVYASAQAGFRPRAGDVWFVFEDSTDRIIIGSMTEAEWLEFISDAETDIMQDDGQGILQEESEDLVYQSMINEPEAVRNTVLSQRMQYPRDRAVSIRCMENAGYRCEIDPAHETFTNRSTGQPYIEAHHLIPLSRHREFTNSLDVPANIVALCPGCHRKIHHAAIEDCEDIITQLHTSRSAALDAAGIGIDLDRLKGFYE